MRDKCKNSDDYNVDDDDDDGVDNKKLTALWALRNAFLTLRERVLEYNFEHNIQVCIYLYIRVCVWCVCEYVSVIFYSRF